MFNRSSNSARLAAVCDWGGLVASVESPEAVGDTTRGETGEAPDERVGLGGAGPLGSDPNLLRSISLLSRVLLPATS